MGITCRYTNTNGESQSAQICSGKIGDGMVPAITLCQQPNLIVTTPNYRSNCEVVALESSAPTPAPAGSVQKQLWFSSLIDFTTTGNTNIYLVPDDFYLMIDTLEIVTLEITTPNVAPTVKFGTSTDDDLFFGPILSQSNATNTRHVAESPQNLITAGNTISGGVHSQSTAAVHTGLFIFTGYLIPY